MKLSNMWYIGNPGRGAGYKDHGPFLTEDEAYIYASESGLDREYGEFEVWEDDNQELNKCLHH